MRINARASQLLSIATEAAVERRHTAIWRWRKRRRLAEQHEAALAEHDMMVFGHLLSQGYRVHRENGLTLFRKEETT